MSSRINSVTSLSRSLRSTYKEVQPEVASDKFLCRLVAEADFPDSCLHNSLLVMPPAARPPNDFLFTPERRYCLHHVLQRSRNSGLRGPTLRPEVPLSLHMLHCRSPSRGASGERNTTKLVMKHQGLWGVYINAGDMNERPSLGDRKGIGGCGRASHRGSARDTLSVLSTKVISSSIMFRLL